MDGLGPQIQIQSPRNNLLNVNKRAAQLQTFVEKGLDKPLYPRYPGLGHPLSIDRALWIAQYREKARQSISTNRY